MIHVLSDANDHQITERKFIAFCVFNSILMLDVDVRCRNIQNIQ